jgi:hypothetical protein
MLLLYLDPSSGSILLQLLIAALAGSKKIISQAEAWELGRSR